MMIRTIQAKNNCQGFTLVELMIVVAIIGVLAAIAIPQFSAYRTRSFNANAKALNEMGIVVQADLNAELGCYGHSEAVAATLAAGAGVAAPAVSSTVPALAIGATAAVGGGRLNGTNIVTGKIFSVPLGVGNRMTLDSSESAVGAAGACPSGGCSNVIYTRADQGDTAYGSDSDMTGTLFSVSNPAWVAAAAGLVATPLAATDNANDIEGIAAGGAPTVTWEQVQ